MSIFFFYSIWTMVSAAGLKYSTHILLDKDITWLSSILIILSIQWIRLIKYPEQTKNNNVHVKLPQTNSNINRKRNR
jgi:hypothetical protein